MIKHIIMFKITDALNEDDRLQKAKQMQGILKPLKNTIDTIRFFEVGINGRKTDFSYDVVINSEFDSWAGLETYIKHPEHVKAIELMSGIKKEKAVVDYELR